MNSTLYIPPRPKFKDTHHPFTRITDRIRMHVLDCGSMKCCAYCGQHKHYRLHKGEAK